LLGRRQNAIETAEHGHREHDALVLRRTVWPAQKVRNGPNEIDQFVMACHVRRVFASCHDSKRKRAWAEAYPRATRHTTELLKDSFRMAEDIRYSELRFLQSLPRGTSDIFNHHDPRRWE